MTVAITVAVTLAVLALAGFLYMKFKKPCGCAGSGSSEALAALPGPSNPMATADVAHVTEVSATGSVSTPRLRVMPTFGGLT